MYGQGVCVHCGSAVAVIHPDEGLCYACCMAQDVIEEAAQDVRILLTELAETGQLTGGRKIHIQVSDNMDEVTVRHIV